MKTILRLAVIGRSTIAEQFAGGCILDGRIKITAVYSRKEETGRIFADKIMAMAGYSPQERPFVFTDLDLLASSNQIDAVYIASPNYLHAFQSFVFLQHGKHVLCEKPITTCTEDYQKLLQLAREQKLIYMEAITSVHNRTRRLLKRALKEIGPIVMARLNYAQHSSKYGQYLQGRNPNIFNMDLQTGALHDIGVYAVYGAVDLFGMPKDVRASAGFLTDLADQKAFDTLSDGELKLQSDTPADSSGISLFIYDHFTAAISYSKVGQSVIGSEIIGERGTLQIGMISQYLDMRLNRTKQQVLEASKYEMNPMLSELLEQQKNNPHVSEELPSAAVDPQYESAFSLKLAGFIPKEEIMKCEAADFYLYITDPSSKSEYQEVSELAYKVQQCMDRIKSQASIRYGSF